MKYMTVSLADFDDILLLKNQYTKEYIASNEILLLQETETSVLVGITETCTEQTKAYVQKYHYPKTVTFALIARSELASFIGGNTETEQDSDSPNVSNSEDFTLDSIAPDAPVVNIINAIIIDALRSRASDIHMEMHENTVCIRYRLDGILKTVKHLPGDLFPKLAARIKIMSKLNIMESRLPQDGRMSVTVEGKTVDIRVSVIPASQAEAIALRIFNDSSRALTLSELGFSSVCYETLTSVIKQHTGLILVTGPTGSGKTTTLHALLQLLPAEELEIITLEDPVEQLIEGVTQIQINEQIGVTFENMLRRVLRHDSDVIMIGEIRDKATAELAVRAALTGHLILATLHTNDSVSAVARLQNMGVEPYLIGTLLRCVVAQRLVRKLCPHCKAEQALNDGVKAVFERHGVQAERLFSATGCHQCKGTGYIGRTVVAEYFVGSTELESLITARKSPAELREYVSTQGMKTLVHDGLQKAASGITSFAELEREIIAHNGSV